jgi:hypothetical protein
MIKGMDVKLGGALSLEREIEVVHLLVEVKHITLWREEVLSVLALIIFERVL